MLRLPGQGESPSFTRNSSSTSINAHDQLFFAVLGEENEPKINQLFARFREYVQLDSAEVTAAQFATIARVLELAVPQTADNIDFATAVLTIAPTCDIAPNWINAVFVAYNKRLSVRKPGDPLSVEKQTSRSARRPSPSRSSSSQILHTFSTQDLRDITEEFGFDRQFDIPTQNKIASDNIIDFTEVLNWLSYCPRKRLLDLERTYPEVKRQRLFVEDLKTELKETKDALDHSNALVEQLQVQQAQGPRAACVDHQREIDELKQQLLDMTGSFVLQCKNVSTAKNRIKELEAELERTKDKHKQVLKTLTAQHEHEQQQQLNDEIQTVMPHRIEELETQLAEQRQAAKNRIKELQAELERTKDKHKQVLKTLAAQHEYEQRFKDEIQELSLQSDQKAGVQTATNRIKELEAQVSQLVGTSKDELDSLYEMFVQHDLDKNGYITCDELATLLSALAQGKKLPQSFVDARMAEGDKNHDGRITFQEYVEMQTGKFIPGLDEYKKGFESLGPKDGRVSVDLVKKKLMSLNAQGTPEEIEEHVSSFDKRGDGKIGFDAYFTVMTHFTGTKARIEALQSRQLRRATGTTEATADRIKDLQAQLEQQKQSPLDADLQTEFKAMTESFVLQCKNVSIAKNRIKEVEAELERTKDKHKQVLKTLAAQHEYEQKQLKDDLQVDLKAMTESFVSQCKNVSVAKNHMKEVEAELERTKDKQKQVLKTVSAQHEHEQKLLTVEIQGAKQGRARASLLSTTQETNRIKVLFTSWLSRRQIIKHPEPETMCLQWPSLSQLAILLVTQTCVRLTTWLTRWTNRRSKKQE